MNQVAPERTILTAYVPRPWQAEVHAARKRFTVVVAHRRSGKTVLACNLLVSCAMRCRKPNPRFAYISPYLKQSRQVAWDILKHYSRPIPGVVFNEQLGQASCLGAR